MPVAQSAAAELKPETAAAFDRYVQIAERRMDEFDIDPKAHVETPSGRDRPLDLGDLKSAEDWARKGLTT